jgi:hypothetical protein
MLLFLCFVVVCSAEAIVAPNPSGVSTACILTDPCTLRNAIDSGDASIRLLPGSYNLSTGLTINRPLSISRFDPLSTVLFDGALVTSSPLFGINCSTGSAVGECREQRMGGFVVDCVFQTLFSMESSFRGFLLESSGQRSLRFAVCECEIAFSGATQMFR